MSDEDLPLFAWARRRVVPFPIARQRGLIRQVAARLLKLTGDKAWSYWRAVLAETRGHLARAGLSEIEQDDELRRLFDEVHAEMQRQCGQDQDRSA
jgi:hypothetical protein